MRLHPESHVLMDCHGDHTVFLDLMAYYLVVRVIGDIFASLLEGPASGNIREGALCCLGIVRWRMGVRRGGRVSCGLFRERTRRQKAAVVEEGQATGGLFWLECLYPPPKFIR